MFENILFFCLMVFLFVLYLRCILLLSLMKLDVKTPIAVLLWMFIAFLVLGIFTYFVSMILFVIDK